jgi:hypothetical protein
MAVGDELRETLRRSRNCIGRSHAQNVEAFAFRVGGELRLRGGGI